jgi:hypothetical protein
LRAVVALIAINMTLVDESFFRGAAHNMTHDWTFLTAIKVARCRIF